MPTFITAALRLTTSLTTRQTFRLLDQRNFRLVIQFIELPGQYADVNWIIR